MTLIALILLAAALAVWCVFWEADRRERQLERANLKRLLDWLDR